MKIINNLYQTWSSDQSDSQEIKDTWCDIEEYLYINCPEQVREYIEDLIMAIAKKAECQAYRAGFCEAFLIWIEILNTMEK